MNNINYEWPDPAKPGIPLNPEKIGWHWVRWIDGMSGGYPLAVQWGIITHWGELGWVDQNLSNPELIKQYEYLGPCIVPGQDNQILEALQLAHERIESEDWQGTCSCSKRATCACLKEHQEILEKLKNAIFILER